MPMFGRSVIFYSRPRSVRIK